MKKHHIFTLLILVSVTISGLAQVANEKVEFVDLASTKGRTIQAQNPAQDKTDLFEITGIGNTTYTSSNVSDGTTASFNHTLKITLSLLSNNKTGNYQLIFYSPAEKMPYCATYRDDQLDIYYPIAMYDGIKQKLEQTFAAKKKPQIKVIQKTTGYREATLVF